MFVGAGVVYFLKTLGVFAFFKYKSIFLKSYIFRKKTNRFSLPDYLRPRPAQRALKELQNTWGVPRYVLRCTISGVSLEAISFLWVSYSLVKHPPRPDCISLLRLLVRKEKKVLGV